MDIWLVSTYSKINDNNNGILDTVISTQIDVHIRILTFCKYGLL